MVTPTPLYAIIITVLISCCEGSLSTRPPLKPTTLEYEKDRARIIGGVAVAPGEIKYQLSLRYRSLHHCGASLIQVEGVQAGLTAGHCVQNLQPEDITLVAGDLRLSERSGTEQERPVSKIVIHENFSFNSSATRLFSFDIALLFFNQPFVLNDFVGTIPLPVAYQETSGTVLVSGWGVYNSNGYISDNLTKLEMPIVSHEPCRKAYTAIVKTFYNHFLCAGFTNSRKDSCKGDSGGPLRSTEEGYLAGIISWGIGCGNPRFPGVNTKVSFFTEWIEKEVKKVKGDGEPKDEDESDEDNER